MIEAYFDGCCEPCNPGGHAAFGAVVRVDGIEVLRTGNYVGHGPAMSNNVAEYSGAIAVLRCVAEHPGVGTVYGDSKLVVMQLSGRWGVRSPSGLYVPFYREAMTLFRPLRKRIKFQWIPREKNDECDRLSKSVLRARDIEFRIQSEESGRNAP